ncbi:MAG: hypothetical protein AB1673_11770, partial [Actinomycetota bacterium]
MARIEIELTSSRPDGSWTWRAAGARQPKGVLPGSLLPDGTKVGEVLRAEVEIDVDGMNVTSVLPSKAKKADSNRIEVVGPPERDRPPVTTDRAPGPRRDTDRAPGPRRDG